MKGAPVGRDVSVVSAPPILLRMGDPHHIVNRRAHGFTLLELLVTIAVAAILLAIAVPSYLAMVQRNTIAANANDLVGDFNYARSEAVARGRPVYICQSADQLQCGDGDWKDGWIIFAPEAGSTDPDGSRLRVHAGLDATIAVDYSRAAGTMVVFDANGFARSSNGTFTITSADTDDSTRVRIATSGRIERLDPGESL